VNTASRITAAEYDRLGRAGVPLADLLDIRTESLRYGQARLRLPWKDNLVRPGGVVSGPALFTLVDMTMYALVMSAVGVQEMAVTSDISIRYLRGAPAGDVLADGRLLKLGRRLAVCEVNLYPADDDRAVAHATGTYVLPAITGD
jgi:uncharacterized protein (TIGR00369 family)